MTKVLCVIPARLNSTRLPRKMLAKIGSRPLIAHTYLAAKKCKKFEEVVVATDSDEIAMALQEYDANVILSPESLKTGSDRVAFVAEKKDCDVVVNLQGDEPFIDVNVLNALVEPMIENSANQIATAASPLDWSTDYNSSDLVKVVCDTKNYALYFSRAPIPYMKVKTAQSSLPVYKHMGLYAFRKKFLLKFAKMPQSPLELAESLEQLRALENGYAIKVAICDYRSIEINNQKELDAAREYWTNL